MIGGVRVTIGASIGPDSIRLTRIFSIDEGNRRCRNLVGLDTGKSVLKCALSVFASDSAELNTLSVKQLQSLAKQNAAGCQSAEKVGR